MTSDLIRALAAAGVGCVFIKRFVQIGTFYPSSKLCSVCGNKLDELKLSTREWTCPKCGTHHDRDVNAAKNIRLEGIRQCRAAGLSVLRRAESAPTPQCSSRQCKTPACRCCCQ